MTKGKGKPVSVSYKDIRKCRSLEEFGFEDDILKQKIVSELKPVLRGEPDGKENTNEEVCGDKKKVLEDIDEINV